MPTHLRALHLHIHLFLQCMWLSWSLNQVLDSVIAEIIPRLAASTRLAPQGLWVCIPSLLPLIGWSLRASGLPVENPWSLPPWDQPGPQGSGFYGLCCWVTASHAEAPAGLETS